MLNEFRKNPLFYAIVVSLAVGFNCYIVYCIYQLVTHRPEPVADAAAPKKHSTICQLVTKRGKEYCIKIDIE